MSVRPDAVPDRAVQEGRDRRHGRRLRTPPIFQLADAGHAIPVGYELDERRSSPYFQIYSDAALRLLGAWRWVWRRLFGIRLPMNFNAPYKATSIVDFWRRMAR